MEGYTHDQARVFSCTPTIDITGKVVLAKLYDEAGAYKGIANTVKPDPATAGVMITFTSAAGQVAPQVIIEAKYRYEPDWTQVHAEFLDPTEGTGKTVTITYDMEVYDDVRVRLGSGWGPGQYATGIEIEKAQFTDLTGVVVGGGADQAVNVPCDLRAFAPGEYSMVFVAEGYGVIAKEIVPIFGPDGYSTDEAE